MMNMVYSRFEMAGAGRIRCEAGWRLDAAWATHLADCDLWYVWDGRGRMRLRGQTIDLQAGVCVWMRPGGRYEAEHDPEAPLGVTFIHFTPYTARGRPCLDDASLPPEVFHVRDPLFMNAVCGKIVRLMKAHDSRTGEPVGARESQAESLLACVVRELLRPDHREPMEAWERHRPAIDKQIALIYENPGAHHNIREMARKAGIAEGYYTRLFNKVSGASPRELIQRARLERARQLLRETHGTISEIAGQAGYADVYQFSRLFKRRMGCPPGKWREQDRI